MTQIKRTLEANIKKRLFQNKAILIFGPRQVGKSTLCERIIAATGKPFLFLSGDEFDTREELSNTNAVRLKNLFGNNKLIYIDEAQRIPNIGLTLKIIVDQIREVQVIATGSSSFDLANLSQEPLTGRKFEFFLYPFSFGELVEESSLLKEKRMLEHRLIFGSYPEIVTHPEDAKERLQLVSGSYLYQDLLMLDQIKKPILLEKLLKALALQLGSEINYHELGQIVGADKITVEKYIDLLEKAYVIFRIPGFNRNIRNELKKGKKIYFFDCGIRNAILGNFNPLSSRSDGGALWENYFLVERMKYLAYQKQDAQFYFWRTTAQQEIDFVEESEGVISAYECKLSTSKKPKFPLPFRRGYPEAQLHVINPQTLTEFIGYNS